MRKGGLAHFATWRTGPTWLASRTRCIWQRRTWGAGRTWRVSLLVNVWQCHRPLAARPLPAEMAARLSDAPGCACTLGSSARPVAPAACDTAAAAAEDVTLHIGSGGTHAPVVVRDLPPAAHVASLAADFVRMPRVSVALI